MTVYVQRKHRSRQVRFVRPKLTGLQVTGLGSLNQIHCTLPGDGRKLGLEYMYFRLLAEGIWIAQRGLISLNFAMTPQDVEDFGRITGDIGLELVQLLSASL